MDLNYHSEDIKNLDYSSRDCQILIREFNVLLYKVCQRYETSIMDIENKYENELQEQRKLCQLYKEQIETKGEMFSLRIIIFNFIRKTKKIIFTITKYTMNVIKKVIIKLGMKELVINTKIYKKLKDKNIIDKYK